MVPARSGQGRPPGGGAERPRAAEPRVAHETAHQEFPILFLLQNLHWPRACGLENSVLSDGLAAQEGRWAQSRALAAARGPGMLGRAGSPHARLLNAQSPSKRLEAVGRQHAGFGRRFQGVLSESSVEIARWAGGSQVGSGAVGSDPGQGVWLEEQPRPAPSGVGPSRRPQPDTDPRRIEAS